MISFNTKNQFEKTTEYLNNCLETASMNKIDEYGARGVALLSEATPKRTGLTAASWTYEIKKISKGYQLVFLNTNIVDGVPIALIIQYGHGTNRGGYVEGKDYINPALKTLIVEIEEDLKRGLVK